LSKDNHPFLSTARHRHLVLKQTLKLPLRFTQNHAVKTFVGIEVWYFSLRQRHCHPASYPMGTGSVTPGRKADHSLLCNNDVKNAWSCIYIPPVDLHGMVISYAKEQLCL